MARTLKVYQQRWCDAMNPEGECPTAPWDDHLTSESCIIYEAAQSMPTSEGCSYFADFGDAICFYRYLRVPEELDTTATPASVSAGAARTVPAIETIVANWNRYRARFSTEEIRRRRYEGERALDRLLRQFVRSGYQSEMGAELIEIVNTTLLDFELRAVFALPDDLDALLASVGNPIITCDFCDDEGADVATSSAPPAFDLNARGHREALAEHLIGVRL
ncbi:MAG TPA: hypothetical protein VFN11_20320 [Ktedonobacterales bacterium]|nr:hypothetical protein [Ktedonobacterales bacterium]